MPSLDIEARPIFLIGFMGAGKSTIGRLLADRLARPFVDLDEQIVAEAHATIPELFAGEGEAGFRAREAELLARVAGEGAQVVAVGGGAPCHGDNLARMRAAGVVVGLGVSVEEILKRIGSGAGRPLLAGASDPRAHFTVETTGLPPSQVVAHILEELSA